MPTSLAKAFEEMFWLACLLLGVLLMISACDGGRSVHVCTYQRRNISERSPGVFGLFLAVLGVYIGFRIGKKKK